MMAVPVSATAVTVTVLSIAGEPLTVFHSMALFLVLGLGMDYVIFVEEMGDEGASTMLAVLLSALTSLLSFGLLAWSSMTVVNAFGITVLIGNGANLVGAMLYRLRRQKNEKWSS